MTAGVTTTLLDTDPALTFVLLHFRMEDRISAAIFNAAMADPVLARRVVQHKLKHDLFRQQAVDALNGGKL